MARASTALPRAQLGRQLVKKELSFPVGDDAREHLGSTALSRWGAPRPWTRRAASTGAARAHPRRGRLARAPSSSLRVAGCGLSRGDHHEGRPREGRAPSPCRPGASRERAAAPRPVGRSRLVGQHGREPSRDAERLEAGETAHVLHLLAEARRRLVQHGTREGGGVEIHRSYDVNHRFVEFLSEL